MCRMVNYGKFKFRSVMNAIRRPSQLLALQSCNSAHPTHIPMHNQQTAPNPLHQVSSQTANAGMDNKMEATVFLGSIGGYLESEGDLVSRLRTPYNHMITLLIPIVNLLTMSPWPSE